jgi:hypothetical protein
MLKLPERRGDPLPVLLVELQLLIVDVELMLEGADRVEALVRY